jgi:hypothetical protein
MKDELEIFFTAFVQSQRIFPKNGKSKNSSELTLEDKKALAISEYITKRTRYDQLESKTGGR